MRLRRQVIVAAVVAAAVVLAGCAGGDDADTSAVEEGSVGAAPGTAETGVDGEAAVGAEDTRAPLGVPATAGRDVIRRAELELAVENPETAVEDLTAAVERAGGFVADADLRRGDDGLLLGTLRVRVPARELDATLRRLEEIALEVRGKQLSSEDVTGEIVDVDSQLRNLRALETELLTLLGEARQRGSTEEVLTVFERVRGVREEIERLEGRRARLGDLVALATVDVRLVRTEAGTTVVADDEPWQPSTIAREALAATGGALRAVATGTIWLVLTGLPITAMILTPLLGLWWLLRHRRRADAPAAG